MDDNFKKRAINNIKNDPLYYFNLYLKKLFSFVLYNYNSNYPNYYNPLVVAPEIIYSFLGLIGFIINLINKKKLYKVTILYLFYMFLIPTFFILPRYKLFILPLIIIFIGIFIKYILSNKNSFKKQYRSVKKYFELSSLTLNLDRPFFLLYHFIGIILYFFFHIIIFKGNSKNIKIFRYERTHLQKCFFINFKCISKVVIVRVKNQFN